MAQLSSDNLNFLSNLEIHNDRDWFTANKDWYKRSLDEFKSFSEDLKEAMLAYDQIDTLKVYRIYRDVRFSKNKTPYKHNWSGFLTREGVYRRGGYYFHIEPGDRSIIGGGFYKPESADLKLIRQKIARDPDELRAVINAPGFVQTFGELQGDKVKTAPKGYAKDDPAIDLLRYKSFLAIRNFTDEEVLSADFTEKVVQTYQAIRPFFDYMTDVLTTDMNGVPLYGDED